MIDKRITLIRDGKVIKKLVEAFVGEFWFAPQDVLLRSVETIIWAKRYFEPPVLDIGIGNGGDSKYLFSMNQIIDMGIDKDPRGVNLAKSCGIYRNVAVVDATRMIFKSSSFNTIVSNSTFEHIKNDRDAIGQVSRVLKKGGLFYLTVPTPDLMKFLKELGIAKREIKRYNKRVDHFHFRSINEWEKILRNNGLSLIFHKTYFPKTVVKTWYKFYKIATFRPYKRELWSYLKDSPYGKLFPSFLVKPLLSQIIFKKVKKSFQDKGAMHFLITQKIR